MNSTYLTAPDGGGWSFPWWAFVPVVAVFAGVLVFQYRRAGRGRAFPRTPVKTQVLIGVGLVAVFLGIVVVAEMA